MAAEDTVSRGTLRDTDVTLGLPHNRTPQFGGQPEHILRQEIAKATA